MAMMRAIALLGATLGSLLTGCTTVPEAEDVVVDAKRKATPEPNAIPVAEPVENIAEPVEAAPEPEAVPEPEAAPEPEAVPEPEPAPKAKRPPPFEPKPVRPRIVVEKGRDACGGVDAKGFPAISDDGKTVVLPRDDQLQSQGTAGTTRLEWHDVASGSIRQSQPIALDPVFHDSGEDSGLVDCKRTARNSRQNASAANEALDAVSWHTMEKLPVAFHDFGFDAESHAEHLRTVPPADRVVQILAQQGEVVLRIPGVKVLERHPKTAEEPIAVYADRATGTVLIVFRSCLGTSHTCDPSYAGQVVHWNPETFATIDARPCNPDQPERSDGRLGWASCEAVQFEVSPPMWEHEEE
jgi:hypothetical protein